MEVPNSLLILYEDEGLLAVDKPAGLPCIPPRGPDRDCLLGRLEAVWGKLFVVHRLDSEVSGVILFAKIALVHSLLNDQFAGREIAKTYAAVVHGAIMEDRGSIDKPIRQFGSGRMGIDLERGKPSLTDYAVEERHGSFTRVAIFPRTGRRHQIRVHFYSIGHPVVGDLRYGDRAIQSAYPRLMLHASALTFRHPSGRPVTVESPPQSGLLSFLVTCDRDPRASV